MSLLEGGNYGDAVKFFDGVQREYPYSIWATKSILMAAYANYLGQKYDAAIAGVDHFIKLHPGSPDIAYAYYLRALCYYDQMEDIQRDQSITRHAMNALRDVIHRFPHSKYATDAKLKIALCRDLLAGHDMAIGRWYETHREYQAAINRFNMVVNHYQTTSHVPEALERLTECYLALGLTSEARKTTAVLGYNFPGSQWYANAYALVTGKGGADNGSGTEKLSWLEQAWHAMF